MRSKTSILDLSDRLFLITLTPKQLREASICRDSPQASSSNMAGGGASFTFFHRSVMF